MCEICFAFYWFTFSSVCVCVCVFVILFIYLFCCKCLLKYVLTICNTSIKWGEWGKHVFFTFSHYISFSYAFPTLSYLWKVARTQNWVAHTPPFKAFSCETFPCRWNFSAVFTFVKHFSASFSLRKSLDVFSLHLFLFHCVILFQCLIVYLLCKCLSVRCKYIRW